MTLSRRMLVLRAVVEDYIRSQEPVSSSSLASRHHLGVSSATVRNDMAALEEEGYLIQPHTSAGRIPTEQGYRFFVDRLSTVLTLSNAQKVGIYNFLNNSISLQDALQRAAKLLASITGQVAVISSPALSKSTLRHAEIVPLTTITILVVVITETGSVAEHTLVVSSMPDDALLEHFSRRVNELCLGRSLHESARLVRTIAQEPQYAGTGPVAEHLADAFSSMADGEQVNDMYMTGTSRLAHKSSIDDMAPLFDALEEEMVLMKLMVSLSEESDEVNVAIGSETHTPGLINASVVSSGYGRSITSGNIRYSDQDGNNSKLDGDHPHIGQQYDPEDLVLKPKGHAANRESIEPVAFVGSIGPTHMDYATTMAAVRAVARYLTTSITPHSDGGQD